MQFKIILKSLFSSIQTSEIPLLTSKLSFISNEAMLFFEKSTAPFFDRILSIKNKAGGSNSPVLFFTLGHDNSTFLIFSFYHCLEVIIWTTQSMSEKYFHIRMK